MRRARHRAASRDRACAARSGNDRSRPWRPLDPPAAARAARAARARCRASPRIQEIRLRPRSRSARCDTGSSVRAACRGCGRARRHRGERAARRGSPRLAPMPTYATVMPERGSPDRSALFLPRRRRRRFFAGRSSGSSMARARLGVAPWKRATTPPAPPALRRSPRAARGNRRPCESAAVRGAAAARWPERCSKRGCIAQTSRIVAVSLRVIASFSHCTSRISSIANSSAGSEGSPRRSRARQAASTSCHSSAAKRNAGETDFPSCTRVVGLCERERDEALAERLVEDHVE